MQHENAKKDTTSDFTVMLWYQRGTNQMVFIRVHNKLIKLINVKQNRYLHKKMCPNVSQGTNI